MNRAASHATAQDIVVTRWGARFMGRRFPCAIGKGGITDNKREGDGATPRGTHYIPELMFRPDRMPLLQTSALNGTMKADKILPRDLWCDAAEQDAYNLKVQAPFTASHEKLRRADPLYDLILTTDWNWPFATPHKGSAIFIHRWRKPRYPTEGCVAFRPDHLRWIAAHITSRTRLIIK